MVPPVVRDLLIATSIGWIALEARQGLHRRAEGVSSDEGSYRFLRISTFVGWLVGVGVGRAVPAAAIHPERLWAWVGLVLLWCGIALRFWSFHTLGRYFTFVVQTSPDQPVITAGPYRVVRHPSYAGILLAVVGIGLVIGNWLTLLIGTAGVLVGIVNRIAVEERALSRELGDRYTAYAKTHKRLIPYVW
jgi:protein-S-isoprenylcysteine O-methyltransferase Ste14